MNTRNIQVRWCHVVGYGYLTLLNEMRRSSQQRPGPSRIKDQNRQVGLLWTLLTSRHLCIHYYVACAVHLTCASSHVETEAVSPQDYYWF